MGNENTIDALTIPQIQQGGILNEDGNNLRSGGQYGVSDGHVACIGCHRSTPDGNSVGFTDQVALGLRLRRRSDGDRSATSPPG